MFQNITSYYRGWGGGWSEREKKLYYSSITGVGRDLKIRDFVSRKKEMTPFGVKNAFILQSMTIQKMDQKYMFFSIFKHGVIFPNFL